MMPFPQLTREQMADFRKRCLCECHHHLGWEERPYLVLNHLCQRCLDDAYAPWPDLLDSLPR